MRFFLFSLCLLAACSSSSGAPDGNEISSLSPPSEVSADIHDVLAAATELEIFALHPSPYSIEKDGLADAPKFYEYAQLGSAKLTDAKARFEVVSNVYKGIEDSDGTVAACFDPRHGFRATAAGHVAEFVICFHCLSMHMYFDGVKSGARTTEAPGAVLTRIWNEAGLTVDGQ